DKFRTLFNRLFDFSSRLDANLLHGLSGFFRDLLNGLSGFLGDLLDTFPYRNRFLRALISRRRRCHCWSLGSYLDLGSERALVGSRIEIVQGVIVIARNVSPDMDEGRSG